MKQSAGILLYRKVNTYPEFFLVHPGGPFFMRKNEGWWTIPKGEFTAEETALTAAVREFREETGYTPEGEFTALEPVRQKGGKLVYGWAAEGDLDPGQLVSNTFEMIWPPRSGKLKTFPEIDLGAWFGYAEAVRMINTSQAAFIEELYRLKEWEREQTA